MFFVVYKEDFYVDLFIFLVFSPEKRSYGRVTEFFLNERLELVEHNLLSYHTHTKTKLKIYGVSDKNSRASRSNTSARTL